MSRGSKSGNRGSSPNVDPVKVAREQAKKEAEAKLLEARIARFDAAAKLVHEKVDRIPGGSMLLSAILHSQAFRGMRQRWQIAKCRKMVQQPRTAAALKAITRPTLKDFLKLDRSEKWDCLGYEDRETGMVDVLAKILGIKLDPEPTLDQFLKDPKAAGGKAVAKAAAKDDAEDDE